MAQKTEKEETEFKVPEALSLCVNNCGFTGNPATNNMCQKCFSATTSATTITTTSNNLPSNSTTTTASSSTTTTTTTSVTTMEAATTTTSSFMSGSRILKFTGERSVRSSSSRSPVKDLVRDTSQRTFSDDVSKREVNRCTGCRRKVGLTGFRCRCGELFCWEHRYSDRHDCSYDYKSAGREAIARENPIVKAAKIVRV